MSYERLLRTTFKATDEKDYLDNVVGGGVDCALSHRLGDQEEIIPGGFS